MQKRSAQRVFKIKYRQWDLGKPCLQTKDDETDFQMIFCTSYQLKGN